MSTFCLSCGSFSRNEISNDSIIYELTKDGEEKEADSNQLEDYKTFSCGACGSENLVWFCEDKLTEKQLKQLFIDDLGIEIDDENDIGKEEYHRRLKLMLLFAVETDRLLETRDYDLKQLYKKCKELKLIDREMKKKLVVFSL